jgi:hypothetical protein
LYCYDVQNFQSTVLVLRFVPWEGLELDRSTIGYHGAQRTLTMNHSQCYPSPFVVVVVAVVGDVLIFGWWN